MIRLSKRSWGVGALLAVFGFCGICSAASPTHEQTREIRIQGEEQRSLQTMALRSDGRIAALIAPPRHGVSSAEAKGPLTSEVRLFDEDGNEQARWNVKFHGQSIGAGPDGEIYVGGDGRIARFDKEGKLLSEIELPHLATLLADQDQIRESAQSVLDQIQESLKETRKQFDEQKEQLQQKIDQLKKELAEKSTPALKRRLDRYNEQIKQLDSFSDQYEIPSLEDMIRQTTDRLRIVNAVAVTDKDIFVATGQQRGYGYAVWRMTRDFQEPKQVLTDLGGCCGQMDVQARGDELYVAENTKHRVGRYTRDGERIDAFGQRSEKAEGEGFGGCCNPMNLRVTRDGRIYTSESEGIVRCFSSEGKPVDIVGRMKLEHGCKNVAVDVSADGRKVFFCDQPGARIIVLTRSEPAEAAAKE